MGQGQLELWTEESDGDSETDLSRKDGLSIGTQPDILQERWVHAS